MKLQSFVWTTFIVFSLLYLVSLQITNYLNTSLEKTRIENVSKEKIARIEAETNRQKIEQLEREELLNAIREYGK